MKKLIVFILVLTGICSTNSFSQTSKGPIIKFESVVYDYGTIYQGANGGCDFKFKNIGDEPLLLSDVRSSCGCTIPKWPKDPIFPGQSAVIQVTYDTKRLGTISKQISVVSNATEGTLTLSIKGNIIQKPTEVLPEKQVNSGFTPTAN
ncbi:MAG: DUF1573 domain-containing protein [Bacteroidota bacterium]